jgi:crotonobetainyl-CoA:carnitine CoA-transferase CaiB-like acyl-CoA transferase
MAGPLLGGRAVEISMFQQGPAAGFPWDFSVTSASWRRRAPHLGEHTDEILCGLGYRAEEIEALRKEGVIL